jgi:hypothetical protein
MTTVINGSSPSITFSDSTTQDSAGLTKVNPVISSGVLTFADASTQASAGLTSASSLTAANLTGSRTIPKGTMPAGTILQVISASTTAPFSTSSSSFVSVTGLSVSITPTSSSSKVMVLGSISYSGGGGENATIQLQKNGSAIFQGDAQGSRKRGFSESNGAYSVISNGLNFVDSPATTSATTYSIAMAQNGGQTGYVNQTAANRDPYESTTASTITVMEVAV